MVKESDFAKIVIKDEELPLLVLRKVAPASTPDDQFCKKNGKRKNMWTSCIIQKKARKQDWSSKMIENKEGNDSEEFELSDYVEHDKKYFFVHSAKISCKLCSFKGDLIVQHYKVSHPESEVLISRIDPNITEILVEDAIRNREEYEKDHLELEKMTCNFKCPFCLMLVQDTAHAYYNHISSHTGEYCLHCNHCSYCTNNHTNIHSHLKQMHYNIQKAQYRMVYLDPKISKYLFGYICSECNFIQLIRTTVEEHALVYHRGMSEIHRVNLGLLLHNDIADENHMNEIHSNQNHSHLNCMNAITSESSKTHNYNLKLPAKAAELNNLLVQMEEFEQVKVKVELKDLDEDPCPIELTTFIWQPDLDIKEESTSDRTEMFQWTDEDARKTRITTFDRLQTKLVTELVKESQNVQMHMPSIPLILKDEEEALSSEVKLPVITFAQQLVSTSEDDLKCASVLRDIPMIDTEKENRKCPKAVAIMMKPSLLSALYKCPKYDCSFATTLPLSFQKHFATHQPILMDTLVPCLYCDYKVLCSSYVIHLEVKHGHCLFGCSDCFYRTTNSYFVTMHREVAHPNTEFNILQLEVVTSNRISTNTTAANLDELVLPYNCEDDGFLSCSFKTLYFDEYLKHVEVIHQVNELGSFSSEHEPQKEAVMEGWLAKEVGPFQCRYCKKATVTHQEMGRHQAVFHAQEQCLFYYRKFVPNDTVVIPEQVNLLDPSFINHVIHLPDQIHLCNFKLTDGLLSSTSVKLTNFESDVSLTLLPPPVQDIKTDLDQLSVSLDEPETFSVLVNELGSLCLDEQPKGGSAHNDTSGTACKLQCKWKGCYQTLDSQTALVKHIEKNHVWLQRGAKSACFWVDCPRKSKPYSTKWNLLAHIRSHTGEKPYKCTFQGCNKAFSYLPSIKVHLRSHTKKRRRITSKDQHQRRHYNTISYTCQVTGCSEMYTDSDNLQKCVKNHTVEEQLKVKLLEDEQKEGNLVLEKSSNSSDRAKTQRMNYDSCKWKGCCEIYDFQTTLVKHIEKNHIRSQREKIFSCFWIDCPRKSKPYTSKEMLLVHMRTHTGEKPYRCTFQGCNKTFSYLSSIKMHQRSHTRKRIYLCQFSNCFQSFFTSYHRSNHHRILHNLEEYACQVSGCSKNYNHWSTLQEHMKNHTVDEQLKAKQMSVEKKQKQDDLVLKKSSNSSDQTKHQGTPYDTLQCKWKGCYQTCLSQTALVKHVEKNHIQLQKGRKLSCFWINCLRKSEPYTTKQNLLKHMRVHTGGKPHKCPFKGCNKTCSQLSDLEVHQRRHTGERPYFCQFSNCFKTFYTSSVRNIHERLHYDPEVYTCQVSSCSRKYGGPQGLRLHMEKHTVDEQLEAEQKTIEKKQKQSDFMFSNSSGGTKHQSTQCDILQCKWKGCCQTYNSQTALIKHIRKSHIQLQKGRKFTCFWINCPRKSKPFTKKSNLSVHMRVHSGEKPYKCSGCNKAFSRLSSLQVHQRSHTGEKPYLCQFSNCYKSFINSDVRNNHQRLHYDPEAYTCQVTGCSKKYTSPQNLQTHLRKHTVDEQLEAEQKTIKKKQKQSESSDNLDGIKRTESDTEKYTSCSKKYADSSSPQKHMENHTLSEEPEVKQESVKNEQKENDFIVYQL